MKNKIAIVTGGTGALGRKIVEKLSSEGFKIYVPTLTMEEFTSVFDRSADESEIEPGIRKIFGFDCNATDESSAVEFVRKVAVLEKGNIGYLVNTVGGIDAPSQTDLLTAVSVQKMLALNFFSAFYFTTETLKYMKLNGFGRIVSIGALAALEPSPKRFAYSVSKQAVINLMNTVSEEYKDNNIRCSTIVPSVIDTPANREWGSEEEIKNWVKPEDIAEIVSGLFSEGFGPVRSSIIKAVGSS